MKKCNLRLNLISLSFFVQYSSPAVLLIKYIVAEVPKMTSAYMDTTFLNRIELKYDS